MDLAQDLPGAPGQRALLRLLGVGFGVAVSIGVAIGSGVLRSPGAVAAATGSAPILLALWALGGVHVLLASNTVAELGTAMPRAGGAFVFSQRAFGDLGGLVVGWSVWGATVAGIAACAIAFADFAVVLTPAAAPFRLPIALGLLALLHAANILGLREGATLQNVTSALKALLLMGFVIAVFALVPAAAHPAPETAPHLELGLAGFAGLVGAYQLITGAYSGFDAPVYFSEENIAPERSIPRALFLGVGLTMLLYVCANAALVHALPVAALAKSALPFAELLQRLAGPWGAALFAVGAMIIVLSCANANILEAARILYALGRERLLPRAMTEVNRGGSPHVAYYVGAALCVALTLTGGFSLVFALVGTLTTVAQVLTDASIFVLRRTAPDLPRPYRAIGYPVIPALVLAFDAVILVLFALSDLRGAAFALLISALCVPLAFWARRRRGPVAVAA